MDGQPTDITLDFYGRASTNLHRPATVVGFIENVPAGAHIITVFVGPVPFGNGNGFYPPQAVYTGFSNQQFLLEVTEM